MSEKIQCDAERYGDDCNECYCKTPYLHRVAYSILFKLFITPKIDSDLVYKYTQSICPNLTCCPECRMDDFTHVEGCKLEDKLYKEVNF